MTRQDSGGDRRDTAKVLYITYDGLTDPLGQSQVLPYLLGLAALGHRITILSCEKAAAFDNDGEAIRRVCAAGGIEWAPLRYHKHPPVVSSAYDQAMLTRTAARLHRQRRFDFAHCRSYIPAATGLHLKRRYGVPLLFDMRGFWPEEKSEGGSWNLRNPVFRLVYRHFKRLESRLLSEADAIVSLTEAGKTELLRRPELRGEPRRIEVIPCCVEVDHFMLAGPESRGAARYALGIADDASVLAYLGSLGGNYMLGEILDFFRVYRTRHPGARFLFITRESPQAIEDRAANLGLDPRDLVIRAAQRDEVPRLLAAADLGIAFKQPSFSALGCSPTKLGEMLAVGLPIVANAGVGDVAQTLEQTRAGVVVGGFDEDKYRQALNEVERSSVQPDDRRQAAIDCFDVKLGIGRYDAIYRRLLAPVGNQGACR
ncbi:glycosyltransferase family 4 protein [Sphingomonas sp. URHD0057]|uniref:glycosyltransferase family 4 protein n=1 Tax=Sphingomonas sp. URHD0057 TaxID=1380389 RepID=UPI000490CE46|nr:glycosyltransferase family 4 protein [Sphingomonas sp. URHD0057]